MYVYEYLLHVGAQKAAQTFLNEVRRMKLWMTMRVKMRMKIRKLMRIRMSPMTS